MAIIGLLAKKSKNKDDDGHEGAVSQHYGYSHQLIKPVYICMGSKKQPIPGTLAQRSNDYLTGILPDLKDAQLKHGRAFLMSTSSKASSRVTGNTLMTGRWTSCMLAFIEIRRILAEIRNMKETASNEGSVDSGSRKYFSTHGSIEGHIH
ncbi:hypothetical protein ARMGADRAFT_1037165 [Armillaria gallica]|uniref:Uncharacterized protein n=1 Tax=Armillaria gallica TaxID=47427 RepID=A0A2H3CN45_ARMGA|nr:hypothetical protein ARMGADRAFT_1037165 [Armillaria gallica]